MKIIDRGTIITGKQGTDQQSCCFPGICVLPDNRWICGFRAAPSKKETAGQKALITYSDDEGKTWNAPMDCFTPPSVDGAPGLFHAVYLTALGGKRVLATLFWVDNHDPDLPFFNEETEGLLDSKTFFSLSDDNGLSWSEPWLMDTTPFKQPTPITGPVLILPNGEWACQFELNKHYYDTAEWRHSSVIMFSKDEGRTWPEHAITSNDPENKLFYWDQRPAVLADGKILDFFWTYNNDTKKYNNITARESLDNGRNWSEIWDTGVAGQPAPPVSVSDGNTAMVFVERDQEPVIKMRINKDNGKTWLDDTEMIIYETSTSSQTWQKKSMQDTWDEMSKFSIGLPATARLHNGDILIVYYAGSNPDLTDIQWCRVGN